MTSAYFGIGPLTVCSAFYRRRPRDDFKILRLTWKNAVMYIFFSRCRSQLQTLFLLSSKENASLSALERASTTDHCFLSISFLLTKGILGAYRTHRNNKNSSKNYIFRSLAVTLSVLLYSTARLIVLVPFSPRDVHN